MTSLYAEPVHFPKLTHRFIHPFCLWGEPLDEDMWRFSWLLLRSVVWRSEFLSIISETIPVSIVTDWHDERHVSNIHYSKYAVRCIRDNCVSINETRDRVICYNKPWSRKHAQFPKHWIIIFHVPVRQRVLITESRCRKLNISLWKSRRIIRNLGVAPHFFDSALDANEEAAQSLAALPLGKKLRYPM
jgi:hypothetical protein